MLFAALEYVWQCQLHRGCQENFNTISSQYSAYCLEIPKVFCKSRLSHAEIKICHNVRPHDTFSEIYLCRKFIFGFCCQEVKYIFMNFIFTNGGNPVLYALLRQGDPGIRDVDICGTTSLYAVLVKVFNQIKLCF